MSEEDINLYPWRKKVKTLPSSLKDPIVNLIQIGHVPKLSVFREKIRENLGINRKPLTAYKIDSARSELQELMKHTDLYDKAMWKPRNIKTTVEGE